MPITISYGNPALVGAASFAIGREKGKMKAGAKAADMAQGMLDRRDKKRDDERNRYDRLRKENADRNQRSAIEAGRIAQDQDEARMKSEAAENKADQRARERAEDFDFRQKSQQAGFDQRDREAAARARAEQEKRAREQGNLPPSSKYFPPSSGGGGGGMPSGGIPPASMPNSGMPSGRATYPDGRPVPPSLQFAIDQATGIRTMEYDPYGKDRPVDSTGGTPPPMALPPNAPLSPDVSEMGGFPQSTQEDAYYLNRDRTDDQTALGQTIAPWVEDPSMKSGGRNGRGYVPQRGFYAQRNYDARQARYAQEQEHRDWLRGMQQDYMNSPAQQRRMNELSAYQDQINSGQAPHLNEEQKKSANDQMNREMQQIAQNPSGGQMQTRDQQINDGISNVNINGQEYPIVMGENNVPQVMNGYTPPQQGGDAPQQNGDGSMLQAAPPEGFAVDPYGGQGSGIFSSTAPLDKGAASGLAWSMDKKGYDTNIIAGTGRNEGMFSVQISKKPAEVVKPEEVDSFKPISVDKWSRDIEGIAKWKINNPKYADWSDEKVAKFRSGKPYQDYLKMAQGEVPELEPKTPPTQPEVKQPEAKQPEAKQPEAKKPPLIDPKAGNDDGSPYVDPVDPERQQRLKDAMKSKKAKDAKDAAKAAKDAKAYKANKSRSQKSDKFKGLDPNASPLTTTQQAEKDYSGDADAFIKDPKTTAKEARTLIESIIKSRQ